MLAQLRIQIVNRRNRVLAIVAFLAASSVAFSKVITVPVDGITVSVKRTSITGHVRGIAGSYPPHGVVVTLSSAGVVVKQATTFSAAPTYAFHFPTSTPAATYRVAPVLPSGPIACSIAGQSFYDATIGPTTGDVGPVDFALSCTGPNPTIAAAGSTASVNVVAGASVSLVANVANAAAAPMTVHFTDCGSGTYATAISSGGVASGTFTPPEGVYRICANATLDATGQISSTVEVANVVAMQAPAVTMPLDYNKATATVGTAGGSFAVSDSGAATYTVPIAIPPGPTGMQPSVALTYSSHSGTGAAGFGWSVSGVSAVTRCPATIASNGDKNGINYDTDPTNDLFCLDGQRLVIVGSRVQTGSTTCGSVTAGTYKTEYRTELESYSQIFGIEDEPCLVIGPSRFEVRTKSGQRLIYGIAKNTSNAPLFGDGNAGFWVMSLGYNFDLNTYPAPFLNTVKAWPITHAVDRAGNLISYTYCGDNLTLFPGGPLCTDDPRMSATYSGLPPAAYPPTEVHVKRIAYGGHSTRITDDQWTNDAANNASVEFVYGTRPATDQLRTFDSGGGESNLTYQLYLILTNSGSRWANSYALGYDSGPTTGRTRLTSIMQCALSGGACLPATTFNYTEGADAATPSSFSVSTIAGDSSDINMAGDFDGDGKSDLLYIRSGDSFAKVALSSDNFNQWRQIPLGRTFFTGDKFLADVNGDGKLDFVFKNDNNAFIVCDLQLRPGSYGPALCTDTGVFANFYLTGDFNGDGRTDILALDGQLPTSTPGYGFHLYLGTATASLAAGQALTISVTPGYGGSYSNQFTVGDFNGDGRTDVAYRGNMVSCRYGDKPGLGTDTGCETDTAATGINICLSRPNPDHSVALVCGPQANGPNGLFSKSIAMDFNGDGIADFAYPADPAGSTNLWNICLSSGNGNFQRVASGNPVQDGHYLTNSLCKTTAIFNGTVNDVVFGDFDGDGRTDMARFSSGGTWTVCLARTGSVSVNENNVEFRCESRSGGFTLNGGVAGNVLTGDFDGDGKTDLVGYGQSAQNAQSSWLITSPHGIPDQLTTIRNGLGAQIAITHSPLTDSNAYTRGSATAVAGKELVIQSPLYVVTKTQAGDGLGTASTADGTFDTIYTYEGLKGSTEGRGLLGFASRTVTDSTGLTKVTRYYQDAATWYFAGRPKRIQTKATAANANRIVSDSYTEYQLACSPPLSSCVSPQGVYSPQMLRTTERKVDLNGAMIGCSQVANVDSAGALAVDVYGNVLSTQTQTAGSCDLDAGVFATDGIKKAATNVYEAPDVANWIIGRLKSASVVHSGSGYTTVTRKSAFTYNGFSGESCIAPFGHMCSEVVEPDTANSPNTSDREQYLKTLYEYDGRGNTTKVTKRFLTGEADRATTTTYDASGRFVAAVVNAAGHREERSYDDRFGTVTSTRRFLDATRYITTDTPVDNFGRAIGSKTYATDGSVLAVTDITWAAVSNPPLPTTAVYQVTTSTHTGGVATEYFDELQRKVKTDTKTFGGGTAHYSTMFDTLGRVKTSWEPPSTNSQDASIYHSVAARDDLGRSVMDSDVASGDTMGYAQVYRLYSGLYSASWRVGELKITRKDIEGRIVAVTDCLGNVPFSQFAVGSDLAITCPTIPTAPIRSLVTTYSYDVTGNVVTVATPDGLQRTATYDTRGRKLSSTDPDTGNSTFEYNGADELIGSTQYQQSGSAISVAVTYDVLGRKKTQSGPGNFSASWSYDACGVNGALCSSCSVDGAQLVKRDAAFDGYGRGYASTLGIGNGSCTNPNIVDSLTTYSLPDSQGRTSQLIHPSGIGFKYAYASTNGELQSIIDSKNPSVVHWTANERFPDGHLKAATLGGSAASIAYSYYGFGVAKTITATSGTSTVQNAAYSWTDDNRYLNSRSDTVLGVADSFSYDSLGRVATVNGASVAYDDGGSITSRNGETYTLDSFGGAKRSNRLASVATRSFSYDLAGNLLSDGDHVVTWKGFNMPATMSSASTGATLAWLYDANYARVTETSSATGVTTYFPGMDRIVKDGVTRWRHYINTPEGAVGVVELVGSVVTNRYWLRDHLGSVVREVTPSAGTAVTFGYDAWGKRTNAVTPNPAMTQAGYTGHEMLDEAGLVHMNGRIYDPSLGRFLSADPVLQSPLNGQNYNRYSYVLNNPLSATDPTGFSSKWVQWRGTVAAIAITVVTYGLAEEYVTYALGVMADGGAPVMVGGSVFATETAITMAGGFAAGGIAGGNVESALQGAVFAGLNSALGNVSGWGNVVGHAVVGCAQSAGAGGNCRGGALAAGFSSLTGGIGFGDLRDVPIRVALGAVAAKLAGDKPQNGALTTAFEYLFNFLVHLDAAPRKVDPKGMPVLMYVDDKANTQFTGFLMDLEDWGINVKVTDAFRTNGMQALLSGNAYGGAAYGSSLHEAGFAIDINWNSFNATEQKFVLERATAWGLKWGGGFRPYDPVHFYVDPFASRSQRIQGIRNAQHEFMEGR